MARLDLGKIMRTDLGSTCSTAVLYSCELQCVHLVLSSIAITRHMI